MKSGKTIVLIFLACLTLFAAALLSIYEDVKRKTIDDLNIRQMVHARQAAKGITDYMEHAISTLETWAQMPNIIRIDQSGKELLWNYYNRHHGEIKGISRIDSRGTVIYTLPDEKKIGTDISGQEHIRSIMASHKTVVSDVFVAVQGFRTVAVHVPVFKNGAYDGSLAFLLSFDTIARRYVESIRVGESGYAWVISRKGFEISFPEPGHVGGNIFDTARAFPEVTAMAREMLKGKKGITTYHDIRIVRGHAEKVLKHAVYMPIPLADSFWSIVVATPEDEVMTSLSGFKTKLMVIVFAFLVFSIVSTFLVVRSLTRAREEKVNKALFESEEAFGRVFKTSSDPMLFIKGNRFVECNKAALDLLEMTTEEELLGTVPEDISPPYQPDGRPSPEKAGELIATALREGPQQFEWTHVGIKGKEVYVDVSLTPIVIKGELILHVTWRDITEKKRAAEAVKESERKYRALVETTGTGFCILDDKGAVIDANREYVRFTGHNDLKEILGKNVLAWTAHHEKDKNEKAVARCFTDGYIRNLEIDYVGMDGVITPVEINATVVEMEGTQIILSLCRDIRERKSADKERQSLQAQLIQAQKMETVGTLAGGVAHDFNNILSVILGFGNLCQMSIDKDNPLWPYVDQIVTSAGRAADLVQSLLAFSRKQRITLEPHKVSSVVTSAAKLLNRLLPEDIEFTMNFLDEDAFSMLDVTQITQILMNLATNARDAMPKGGSLTITTERTMIDEKFKKTHGFGRPGEYVKLSVSDTGTGMDEATAKRIFEPFFTTKEVGKGTGLGLASAYGIVKQHNGYITVSSVLLKGTTFNIYLPLTLQPHQQEGPTTGEIKGGSEVILIVEDDPQVRTMFTRILESYGYTCIQAVNGEDAIKVHREHKGKVDLIVLDVVMPGKNGRESLNEITQIDPEVKSIFMSGYTGDIVIDRGVQSRNVDFLQKPVSVTALLSKVREVLDR